MESSITISNLLDRVGDFSILTKSDQAKLMAFFYSVTLGKASFAPGEIRSCFVVEKLPPPANISREFSNLCQGRNPVLMRVQDKYTFQRSAKKELENLYLGAKHTQQVSLTLRGLLGKIQSKEQVAFLEEAITCFEVKCYRSSIVMTWLLAMDILYEYVLSKQLTNFNQAIQTHGKYRKIIVTQKQDFSDIRESDFIELLRVSRIISGDLKKILDEKLGSRNTAAHPNAITITEGKCNAYVEDLIENIITKF